MLTAAVALPLLLLLYFLKLRRQTLRIPSTLLWRKSFEDLQVNAPFQRLRWSVLLALQLLMLLALLLALAEPLWRSGGATASRMVLIIDHSASMNAPAFAASESAEADHPPITRLEAAKRAAIELIEDAANERGRPAEIMVIAFGSTAQVVSTFESNRGVLRDVIRSIGPTDEQANLEAALDLASAFAGSRDESSPADAPPRVVLFSDGVIAPPEQSGRTTFQLRGGDFQFVQAAETVHADAQSQPRSSVDNLGIVALGARRDYDDPARVIVFARLLNAGEGAIDAVVTISIDGRAGTTIRTRVPAATADAPGEVPISQSIDLPNGATLTVAHNHRDQLEADDVAAIVVPPPSQPRIAVVVPAGGSPDPYLNELLAAMEPQRVDAISIDNWSQADPASIDDGSRYDVVVFDRVSGHRLPGVPSLTFGGVPAGIESRAPADERGRAILSWDRQHPVMRNLALDSIVFSGFGSLELPEATATPLAWGPDGPIISLIRTRGARHVVVGFAPGKSNWPLHVSSAMFVQNALEFLTLAGGSSSGAAGGAGGGSGIVHRPGEPITVRAAPNAQAIILAGGGASMSIPVHESRDEDPDSNRDSNSAATRPLVAANSASPTLTLPAIPRAGLYSATGALPPNDVIAVSMLSEVESDIRPRDSISVNAQASAAISSDKQRPLPLWPWLLGAAFVLAVLEWLTYCRRVG